MSKTITIPSNYGSRITVTINGVSYTYAAGTTATVPDEVAACIDNMLAEAPSGVRESAKDAYLQDLIDDIAEVEATVSGLDTRLTAAEGKVLPDYESTDVDKVLTLVTEDEEVVPGWAAAADDSEPAAT